MCYFSFCSQGDLFLQLSDIVVKNDEQKSSPPNKSEMILLYCVEYLTLFYIKSFLKVLPHCIIEEIMS